MTTSETPVFFYGLFMDESLLADKGVRASKTAIGYVDGYRLCIGERATLLPDPAGRAYGVLMRIAPESVAALYSEPSVADYVAETFIVTVVGGEQVPATCYNLPADRLTGANSRYAAALSALAIRLGLPEDYVDQIREFA